MKKKQLMVTCGILAAALCLGGCGKIDGTQTVLTVNDDTVSMGAAMFDLRYQQAEMYSYYEQMYAMYGMKMDGYWSTETTAASDASETSETSEASETSTASEASEASETSTASAASEASEASATSKASEASETSTASETKSSSAKKTTYGQQFKDDIMDTLTNMVLLDQHKDEYGVSVTDEDEAAIKEAAQKFVDDNDAAMLEKNGITADSVAEYMRLYTVYARMQDPMVADVDTNVTDEEAKKSTITYVRIKEDTSSSDSSDTSSAEETTEKKTFASLKDEAQAVLDRLKQEPDIANADMESIAKEVGDDTFTVQVSYDATDAVYDKKLKEAANTLTDGQLYDGVIEGADGNYYLVRMDSVLDREKTDANKDTIIENRKTDLYNQIIDGWKDEAEVKVNESLWKKATVEDAEQYRTKAADSSESSETSETSSAAAESSEASATGESSAAADSQEISSVASETESTVSSAASETAE